jgi:microsomal dipeptidase-like Zn-dependent dipeptidase
MATSIETAIKHFEKKAKLNQSVINTDEVLKVLEAIHQFETLGLTVVGINYVRYDGIDFKDTPVADLYAGGYAVE